MYPYFIAYYIIRTSSGAYELNHEGASIQNLCFWMYYLVPRRPSILRIEIYIQQFSQNSTCVPVEYITILGLLTYSLPFNQSVYCHWVRVFTLHRTYLYTSPQKLQLTTFRFVHYDSVVTISTPVKVNIFIYIYSFNYLFIYQ